MKPYIFGVDLGGTTVKIGLFENEELLDKWEIPTRTEENGKYILGDIADSILLQMQKRGISPDEIRGVGIDVPGAVLEDGTVNRCVNLGWGVVRAHEELNRLLNGIPVEVANDANAAALGEMWKGGGKGYSNVVMVTLGTGVGGGVIINGKIFSGAFGASGELGHMLVNPDETVLCGCGNGRDGVLYSVNTDTGQSLILSRKRIVRAVFAQGGGTDRIGHAPVKLREDDVQFSCRFFADDSVTEAVSRDDVPGRDIHFETIHHE